MRIAIVLLLIVAGFGCKNEAPASDTTETRASKSAVPKSAVVEEAVLKEGDPTPDLKLILQDGSELSLKDTKETVFVYFYPKDDTPGCTVEAQGLRDRYPELKQAGVKVIGVSLQNAASHVAFIEKHDLPFPLAVDDGSAARAFSVPVNGEYAARHSFLMRGGRVVKVWRKVNPAEHAGEVLAAAMSTAE